MDNGAFTTRNQFAHQPTTYLLPIHHDINVPDNDCDSDGPAPLIPDSDDSDGAFAHDRDDDCRSINGQPATTQGNAHRPTNPRPLPR